MQKSLHLFFYKVISTVKNSRIINDLTLSNKLVYLCSSTIRQLPTPSESRIALQVWTGSTSVQTDQISVVCDIVYTCLYDTICYVHIQYNRTSIAQLYLGYKHTTQLKSSQCSQTVSYTHLTLPTNREV